MLIVEFMIYRRISAEPGVPALPASVPSRSAHWLWAGLCVAVILAGNLVGAHAVRRARADAVRSARVELRLDLVERAAALEATVRAARAGLEFVAASPILAALPSALRSPDPVVARFRRLDAEGDLLRYLAAHPELDRIFVEDGASSPILAVGRRASFPVPIPLESTRREPAAGRLRCVLPLSPEGRMIADLNPASLLASLSTGIGRAVLLSSDGAPLAGTPEAFGRLRESGVALGGGAADGDETPGWAIARVPVSLAGFPSTIRWILLRAEHEEDLAGLGVAAGYRTTLGLNLLATIATVILGAASLQLVRRRAQAEERAAQESRMRALEARLDEADRLAAVGRLAATLAHEVRNPLEGMQNWLALAEDDIRARNPESALSSTAKIREGIARVADVVRRVLALARPSSGRTESLDLGDVVTTTVGAVAGTRPFKGIRIETDLERDLPRVRGDAVLLGQLLLNLLLNARDALPSGGIVRVSASSDGREIRLVVQDSGPGIALEMLPRLFEPFASGKGSTGLGLSLCDRVARAHGGRIAAENVPGSGARFSVVLPAEGQVPTPQELPT